MFQNPMDVVYFSQAVENYLPYLPESNDVGHYMMDMVANILGRFLSADSFSSALQVLSSREYENFLQRTLFIKV